MTTLYAGHCQAATDYYFGLGLSLSWTFPSFNQTMAQNANGESQFIFGTYSVLGARLVSFVNRYWPVMHLPAVLWSNDNF